jgi:putative redox protein
LGGTLAVMSAADDERVRGLATFATPASLRAWVREPAWFLDYARSTGVLKTDGFPPDPAAWTHAIANLDPLEAAARIPPRPWLLVHGSADDVVPVEDARLLAEAAGADLELRIVQNGPHRLRHDPRAIALLLGWLDRQ